MTVHEELELMLQIMRKHDLPISPILEYAINEKLQKSSSSHCDKENTSKTEIETRDLSYYRKCFTGLSTGVHNSKKLPHKAVLLLSIMAQIGDGSIVENEIGLNKVVSASFASTWDNLHLGTKIPSVWTPFWYMKSEPFWHFKARTDDIFLQSLLSFAGHPSIGQMRSVIKCAYLDEQLFALMRDKSNRDALSSDLIEIYIKNNHV